MRKHIFTAICGAIAVSAVAVSAQQSGVATLVPRVQSLKFAEPWRPNGAGSATRVIGTVIDIRQVPVARAKVQLGQSMRYVGQQAVQLHGGIGVTDEYVGSHYFKRLTQMEMTGGDTLHHLGTVSAHMQDSAGVFA